MAMPLAFGPGFGAMPNLVKREEEAYASPPPPPPTSMSGVQRVPINQSVAEIISRFVSPPINPPPPLVLTGPVELMPELLKLIQPLMVGSQPPPLPQLPRPSPSAGPFKIEHVVPPALQPQPTTQATHGQTAPTGLENAIQHLEELFNEAIQRGRELLSKSIQGWEELLGLRQQAQTGSGPLPYPWMPGVVEYISYPQLAQPIMVPAPSEAPLTPIRSRTPILIR